MYRNHILTLWRKGLLILFALCLLVGTWGGMGTEAHAQDTLNIKAKSAILVEANTGKILYAFNEKEPLPPASMTKMMTEYLVLEAIQEGRISWDQVVRVSEAAASLEGSQVWLYPGEQRTVEELFTAMAVYSANDATVALAELLGTTETGFVQMMNEKAREMGMNNTHFATSSGYPKKDMVEAYRPQTEGENLMSAEDAAILARELVLKQPEIFRFTTIAKATFREGESGAINMANWNWLIDPLVYAYEGADGLKTGNTEAAGYCITATAKRGDLRLIAVIMGAETINERFIEVRKLLDYGFNHYEYSPLLPGLEPVAGAETVPVNRGRVSEVPVVTAESLMAVIRKGEADKYVPEVLLAPAEQRTAPLEPQQQVGIVKMNYTGDETYRYLSNIPAEQQMDAVALITTEEVKKARWFRLLFQSIVNAIMSLF